MHSRIDVVRIQRIDGFVQRDDEDDEPTYRAAADFLFCQKFNDLTLCCALSKVENCKSFYLLVK